MVICWKGIVIMLYPDLRVTSLDRGEKFFKYIEFHSSSSTKVALWFGLTIGDLAEQAKKTRQINEKL